MQPAEECASLAIADRFARAISARLAELARHSDEPGRLTRLYLGPAHRTAADLVANWMREAGMTVRLDSLATVVGRYEGAEPDAPVLLLGSHIDTVRDAGLFDGNLGVVAAIEVVRAAAVRGRRFPFAIEVLAFGDEEGVRFPSALGGSRAVAGTFDAAILDEHDADGVARRAALAAFGCDAAGAGSEARDPAKTLGYVELHIEQGPVLEAENLPVGIVSGIAGVSRGTIDIVGEAGHAGTVPMWYRRDALAAAAEVILAIERRARREPDVVGTVGRIEAPRGAVNTIPGSVRLSLDFRSPSDLRRKAALFDIGEALSAIAHKRRIQIRPSIPYEMPASPCDERLSAALAAAVERASIAPRQLPSGAGHDAMAFRGTIPFAMLFVRCREGISHNPAEHASDEDIGIAAAILADFLEHLRPENLA